MFKFSFNLPDESAETKEPEKPTETKTAEYECEEVLLSEDLQKGVTINPDHLHVFPATVDILVEYLNCVSLPKEELGLDILSAEMDHSDLIPGRYEGGLKVWECTFDLGELMAENDEYKKLFEKASVLDLGCGSGILGILAVKLGASKVVFQDYNREVLEKVTVKNYSCNCRGTDAESGEESSSSDAEVQFFSGDWSSFVDKVEDQYDVILTSETIYSPSNYAKLIDLFKKKLKPSGVILLAAKTYYFGVGGNLRLFEKALETDGYFSSETIWECESGVKREILKIKSKP
ncbi:AAEL006009-PA [Aedes aegypti]|uniref:protein-histidine N-methyltransferase n=2 Tax=Aedes aegypti TaxID=7159 RepID=Q177V7_AEDAE|nr:histidine protein methyltransferase 1 homolog [Aedes aegypti]EAT42469.1 AAEL006009-PA [Aedes aegypti]